MHILGKYPSVHSILLLRKHPKIFKSQLSDRQVFSKTPENIKTTWPYKYTNMFLSFCVIYQNRKKASDHIYIFCIL